MTAQMSVRIILALILQVYLYGYLQIEVRVLELVDSANLRFAGLIS